MSARVVRQLRIDQSIQLAADQFEIGVAATWPFEQRGTLELASLSTGLLDADMTPYLVDHIVDGVIDEVDLSASSRDMTTTIRGRDSAAAIVDTTLFIEYGGPPKEDVDLPPSLAAIEGVTTTIHMPGSWRASSIARDLAQRVGLELAWQCVDYDLKKPFSVSGTVLSALQQLVAPFSHFEPSKIDIWTEGKALIIRTRPGVVQAAAPGLPAAESFTIQDLRATGISFRSSFLDAIRVVRLTGCGQPGECETITESSTTEEFFDPSGKFVTARIVTRTTKRTPDGAVLKVIKETYTQTPGAKGKPAMQTLRLSKLEKMVADWDRQFFDEDCNKLNTPKEHRQMITIEALDKAADSFSTLKPTQEQRVTFTYDASGFRVLQKSETHKWSKKDNRFNPFEQEITKLQTRGILEYEQVTDKFTASGSTWKHASSKRSPAGGHKPGGSGRALPGNAAAQNPFFVAEIVDNVDGAKDFTYSNPNLTEADLALILKNAQHASQAMETEVSFQAVGIPWLRKGQRIRITDLQNAAEEGILPTPLDTFLVVENHIELVETRDGSSYLSQVRAINWSNPEVE